MLLILGECSVTIVHASRNPGISCTYTTLYVISLHQDRTSPLTPGMSHLAILTAGCCRGPCSPGRRCSCRRPLAWCWRWWAWPRWCWREPPTARQCPAPSLSWSLSHRPCYQVSWTHGQMVTCHQTSDKFTEMQSLFHCFLEFCFSHFILCWK